MFGGEAPEKRPCEIPQVHVGVVAEYVHQFIQRVGIFARHHTVSGGQRGRHFSDPPAANLAFQLLPGNLRNVIEERHRRHHPRIHRRNGVVRSRVGHAA